MNFNSFIGAIADSSGFFPTPALRWVIRKNARKTAREEAICASIIQQANPRENISGHFPWGPEEQMILQQLWQHRDGKQSEWRDVPTDGAEQLYSVTSTEYGDLPVPNAVREPGHVVGDFRQRLNELTGEDL